MLNVLWLFSSVQLNTFTDLIYIYSLGINDVLSASYYTLIKYVFNFSISIEHTGIWKNNSEMDSEPVQGLDQQKPVQVQLNPVLVPVVWLYK